MAAHAPSRFFLVYACAFYTFSLAPPISDNDTTLRRCLVLPLFLSVVSPAPWRRCTRQRVGLGRVGTRCARVRVARKKGGGRQKREYYGICYYLNRAPDHPKRYFFTRKPRTAAAHGLHRAACCSTFAATEHSSSSTLENTENSCSTAAAPAPPVGPRSVPSGLVMSRFVCLEADHYRQAKSGRTGGCI